VRTSYGVLKVIYQKEYRGDPIAVRRIEDTQDNLARVEALIEQLKKTDDPAELAKKRDELKREPEGARRAATRSRSSRASWSTG
jgi:hypothetical protein